jgi:hypothetical protein
MKRSHVPRKIRASPTTSQRKGKRDKLLELNQNAPRREHVYVEDAT